MDGFRVEQCSTKKTDAETSRVSYMDKITWAFPKEMDCVLPTAEEEKSFEEALAHLVRLFPNKRDKDRDTEGRKKLRNGLNACGRKAKMCRKETLKEILNSLQFMERKRMYDPPADDEIRFFLLIKKFVRSMLVFFTAQGSSTVSGTDIHGQYGCFTYSKTLRNVDELAELNRYLADFSAFVSELDIKDGSAMKPLMGIRENDEVAPNIRGSKQRSNMFYWHKFNLAFLDSCSSQDACFPPSSPEEQRSYRRVLDLISSPSFSARNKGSFSPGNVFRENIILRNPKKNVSAELQHEEAKMKKRKRAAEEEEVQKENVKILEGIVEDLRRIGGSDTRVDEEESVLMYKIWMSVASSVHFFFCAIAYEQRNHIIARGGLSDVRKILGVKTRKMMRKNSTNATDFSDHCIKEKICDVINMTVGLWEDMHILVKILRVYEQGLREKLGHGLHEKQGTQPRSKPEF